jgi:hypothetical protein
VRHALLLCLPALVACGKRDRPEDGADRAAASAAELPAPRAAASTSSSTAAAAPAQPEDDPWPWRAPERKAGDRIYSKVRHHWIRPQPAEGSGWLGYISMGDSVPVKGGSAEQALVVEGAQGEWCKAWYAVEPVGYVCTGENATLDPNDPDIAELVKGAADRNKAWPYRYAESLNTPVYAELPSRSEQAAREMGLGEHLAQVVPIRAGKGPPKLLDLPPGGRALLSQVVNGSTIAYTDSFDHEGRTFLLSWDRGFVPADKVKLYEESTFHGVVLGKRHALPIAFFRASDKPRYRRGASGLIEPAGATFPRLSWVALTGVEVTQGDEVFLETKEAGVYCKRDDATVARQIPPPIGLAEEGRRTWLDIGIEDGTLVAYEGERPVYATLISPGRGGAPVPGVELISSASTPTGRMNILAKFVTATMVSGSISTLIHTEVQFTQNIGGPHAIHGVYWHDRFGEKKSGGCVNLSPIDSQRIFEWTEPTLPEGWHGMRSITSAHSFGARTLVVIHK